MIGKAHVSQKSGGFDCILTINNNTYKFNDKTETNVVSNIYNFRRTDDNWDLIIYASGTVKFNNISSSVDLCAVGGGGAGGGSIGYPQGVQGGNGGGGSYDTKTVAPVLKTDYTITIGQGGIANGGTGGTTSLINNDTTIISVSGGGGGITGEGRTDEDQGRPRTFERYCFNDSTYPTVCGPSATASSVSYNKGAGGKGADSAYMQWYSGTNGQPGLLIIRNHR